MMEAKVIQHSISPAGIALVTFQLRYPRFIHAELMTHRVLNRNASSSRAIPVAKMIEQVENHPAMPIHWGANQPGMQARAELQGKDREMAIHLWHVAAKRAAEVAKAMNALGLHKQVANRILEPFQWMNTIVTATEWDNHWELRCHKDAEPNYQALAGAMKHALDNSTPVLREVDRTNAYNWHLPYISDEERRRWRDDPFLLARVSAARCARVSFNNHDGTAPELVKDLDLFEKLAGGRPMHASPLEHQAFPKGSRDSWSGNLRGWSQFRKWVEAEMKLQKAA